VSVDIAMFEHLTMFHLTANDAAGAAQDHQGTARVPRGKVLAEGRKAQRRNGAAPKAV